MTSSASSMESSCLTLILRLVISRYNFFNWTEKTLFPSWSRFGLPSKRAEEADEPSVVDERVKAVYDEVEEADT